ncbi:MAG: pyruvate flavodoxin/ferredoxin oxidoreductase [Planctomycetes bacterium]|nr:pyruvate flavodoxin/ferredoxin oxidoreductase [Planctomycetota bacterium]
MRILIDGSEAIALGALHAGCTFFAGYPITPASSILHHMMRQLPAAGGVAVQGEDEIASIGFCIGAAMTGAKAMTATSGPGMSLYSENIGLAIMGEVPLVIVDVQRMGPATGGATTTAEGDVQFCRWITSGGYPIVVYAATNPADAYRLTVEAFNTAERLRTPVILLSSKELAMTTETVDLEEFHKPPVIERAGGNGTPYGIRDLDDVPGFIAVGGERLTRFTGSIHDEHGVITSDSAKIARKLEHLNRKIESRADELARVQEDRDEGATSLIVAYGACGRAAREAVRMARSRGRKVSLLVLHTLWPVPAGPLRRSLEGVARIVVPELNAGQYAQEIARVAPERQIVPISRVDGGLIDPGRILEEVLR